MNQIIRPVGPSDLNLIARHRSAMFRDSGRPEDVVRAMEEPFCHWLKPRLEDGRYLGWIVEVDGEPVAGIGMMELDWPPHPNHPLEARRGCILNVYVEPGHRRRGIARMMMKRARAEAEARGLTYLVLHATAEGRILYEALGWADTAEMALSIAPAVA
jgi:GNAT superfamily N-acetyltransferase